MKEISRRGVTGIHQFTRKLWEQREGPYGMVTCVQERQWYPPPSFRVAKQSPVQCIWPEIPIFRKVWRRQGCHCTCRSEPWGQGHSCPLYGSFYRPGQLRHTMSQLSPCRVLWLKENYLLGIPASDFQQREKQRSGLCPSDGILWPLPEALTWGVISEAWRGALVGPRFKNLGH